MALENLPAIQEMAELYKLDGKQLLYTIKNTAVDGKINDAELLSCCLVAKEHGLNPLTKEIYFMKTKGGKIQPIVSVDGWIKKCNEHKKFDGMEFEDVLYDGKIQAIRCTIYRKDRTRPTTVTEYLEECRGTSPAWKSHPSRMLRHRALIQCARLAFGFAGIMDPDEYQTWQETVDVTPAEAPQFVDLDIEEAEISQDPEDVVPPKGTVLINEKIMTFVDAVEEFKADIIVCQTEDDITNVLDQWQDTIDQMPGGYQDQCQDIVVNHEI